MQTHRVFNTRQYFRLLTLRFAFPPRSVQRAKGSRRSATPRSKRAVQEGLARLSALTVNAACVPSVNSPGAISPARFPQHRNAKSPITSQEWQDILLSGLDDEHGHPRKLCYFSYSLLFFFFFMSSSAKILRARLHRWWLRRYRHRHRHRRTRGCINLRKLFLP